MKRSFILLSLLMGLAAQLWAAPVGRTQALKNAQSFLQQRGLAGQTRLQYKAPRNAQSQDDAAAYYIFNIGNNQGFVVVSGDDRTEQILGYADNGTFDEQHMPSNMKAWLQSYADQIQALDRQGVTTAQRAPRKSPAKRTVTPLLTSHWKQTEPYNNSCPEDGGEKCVTGCVATSMAQVLYYYRERSKENDVYQLKKDIPGYTGVKGGVSVSTISAESSNLDWDNMIDSYTGSESDEQIEAVANLMAYCGAAVQMDYSANSSGASSVKVAYALRDYFDYDLGSYISRSQYTISEWDNIIYTELKEGRPVIYSGKAPSGAGHSFIVDGCDVDGYYHINWGWGGLSDGYFLLSVCEPESSGTGGAELGAGYSIDQYAIVGAQPNTGASPSFDLALTAIAPYVDGETITISYFRNLTGQDNYYNLGIGYVDALGASHLMKSWDYAASFLEKDYFFEDKSFTLSPSDFAAAGLPTGNYEIVPMSQVGDDGEWMRCHMKAAVINAQYDAEAGSLTLSVRVPIQELQATDIDFPGNKIVGIAQPVSLNIINNGDEFNGVIYLFASKNDNPGNPAGKTGIAVAKNATIATKLAFQPLSSGTYNIWIATDVNCANVIGQSSVTIEGSLPSRDMELVGCMVENSQLKGNYINVYDLLGSRMSGSVTIRNNAPEAYVGSIEVKLWNYDNQEDCGTKTTLVNIAQGESVTIPFDFRNLTYQQDYFLVIFYDEYRTFQSDTYTPIPAVMITRSDGSVQASDSNELVEVPDDAVVVDMTGVADAVALDFSWDLNPNTLFIMGENESEPSGLDDKNVVKGSSATSITITDGYDFVVPKAINAESVYYKRTFEIGTDAQGTGWQTIVLPFSPTEIRGEYNWDLDWFHSRSDVDKDFWLMEFTESVGSQVIFDYAQSFDANIPYIIAVPDDSWGSDWDLRNQEITFMGENVTLLPTSSPAVGSDVYKFVGTMQQQTLESAYLLNDEGSRFASVENSVEQPFRAYFEPKTALTSMPQALSIGFFNDNTTAIAMPQIVSGQAAVYNLQGVRVAIVPVAAGQADLSTLPKGVYIVNGKKVIK